MNQTLSRRKFIACFMIITVLSFSLFSLPVTANEALSAEDYNQIVYDYAHRIHLKYSVDIRYPIRADGYAGIGTGTLDTLEKALFAITPAMVSEISHYFNETRGEFLTFRFTYPPDNLESVDINALARFFPDLGVIELFIPNASSPMIMTGSSPIAISHEIGHAFYTFFTEKHGENKLRTEWASFSSDFAYSYKYPKNPDPYSYVSHYATVDEEEDFAETFAYAFSTGKAGLGLSKYIHLANGGSSNLGRKINYMKRIIPYYLKNTYKAISNISAAQQAAPSTVYRNIHLSGNSLEYIGYEAPYGIFESILSSLKIHEKKSQWINQIGGWEVTDVNGGAYLVFPGATFVTLRIPPPAK